MARPLDLDLRERVVAAALSGKSCRTVAETFGVSVASVVKWTQRYRASGSAAPGKMGGHRPFLLEGERDFLLGRLAEEPDISVRTLADELAARGIVVSHVSVWNLLRREDLTFKKKRARQRAGSS
jgi:transposase